MVVNCLGGGVYLFGLGFKFFIILVVIVFCCCWLVLVVLVLEELVVMLLLSWWLFVLLWVFLDVLWKWIFKWICLKNFLLFFFIWNLFVIDVVGIKLIFLVIVNKDFLCLFNGRFFGIVIISLLVLVRICVDLLMVVLVVFVFGID